MKCIYLLPTFAEKFPYPNQCNLIAIIDFKHRGDLNICITRAEWENQGGE